MQVRVYRANENQESLLSKVRQLSAIDVNGVKIMPERDVIAILSKSNQLDFIQFNKLEYLGQLRLISNGKVIDIQCFELLLDFKCVIVIDLYQDTWIFEHQDYRVFKCLLRIDRLAFHQRYIPFQKMNIFRLNDFKVQDQLKYFLSNNNGDSDIFNSMSERFFQKTDETFSILQRIKDLDEQKK